MYGGYSTRLIDISRDYGLDKTHILNFFKVVSDIIGGYYRHNILTKEESFNKFVRNGFKIRFFKDKNEIIGFLENSAEEIFYLNRFESGYIGRAAKNCIPLVQADKEIMYRIRIGLTYTDLMSYDTGSLFFLEDIYQNVLTVYTRKLFIVSDLSRMMKNFFDAFEIVNKLNSLLGQEYIVRVVSAPSRTGDIEKKIVYGAHGPAEVYLLLYRDEDIDSPVKLFSRYIILKYHTLEKILNEEGYTLDPYGELYGLKVYDIVKEAFQEIFNV